MQTSAETQSESQTNEAGPAADLTPSPRNYGEMLDALAKLGPDDDAAAALKGFTEPTAPTVEATTGDDPAALETDDAPPVEAQNDGDEDEDAASATPEDEPSSPDQPQTRRRSQQGRVTEQLEQERAQRQAAEAANQRLQEERQRQQQRYNEWLGPDDEYEQLSTAAKRGDTLSWEQQEKLRTWDVAREHREALVHEATKHATLRLLNWQAEQADRVTKLPGVDRQVVLENPSFEAVARHFHVAGAKAQQQALLPKLHQAERELTAARERISQLEAELQGSAPRRVARVPSHATGGQSASGWSGNRGGNGLLATPGKRLLEEHFAGPGNGSA
jgi:hypothetical protein